MHRALHSVFVTLGQDLMALTLEELLKVRLSFDFFFILFASFSFFIVHFCFILGRCYRIWDP